MDLLMIYLTIFVSQAVCAIDWDTNCGVRKGCFPSCKSGCQYLVTWQNSSNLNGIDFTLQATESAVNVYLAVGFSKDYRMGDDSVVSCILPSLALQSSYNMGTHNSLVNQSQPNFGLSNINISQTKNVIMCSFTLNISTNSKFFTISDHYILMLVIGDTRLKNGQISIKKHHGIPWSSDSKVDFNSYNVYDLYKMNTPLVKLHGIMMVLAWLLFCGVGIITARYNRDMLPETKLLGTKVWFQVHRGVMIAVVVCIIVGFIPIFIDVGGYSQIAPELGKGAVEAHPVLGIIITVLAFANPIMALFRPNPTDKMRWAFNWLHRGVGVVAVTLAVVNIFLGYLLQRSMLPTVAIDITIVLLVVAAAVCVALEVHQLMANSRTTQQANITTTTSSGTDGMIPESKDNSAKQKASSNRLYILVGFTVAMLGLSLGILGVIAAS